MISVIVPVYNVEQYLCRCIDSILNQTYHDMEIILVDDGSTDTSGSICDNYANLDSRVRVLHKSNNGLSSARNAGLNIAIGEYIAFIDSDDSIDECFFSVLIKTINDFNSDIVECNRSDIYDNNMPNNLNEIDFEPTLFNREDAMSELIDNHFFKQTVWNKLYTKKSIGDLRFEEGKIHEDEFFTWQVFCKNDKFVKINAPLYHYYHRPGSIMESGFSIRRHDIIEARLSRHIYIEQNMPFLNVKSKQSVALTCLFLLQSCLKTKNKKLISEYKPLAKAAFKKINLKNQEINCMNKKFRILMYLSKISLSLCARIWNLLSFRHK